MTKRTKTTKLARVVSLGCFLGLLHFCTGWTGCWDEKPVAAGYLHNCGITDTGEIECWGWDQYSQVADAPIGGGYTQAAVGVAHSCALNATNGAECWGYQYAPPPLSTYRQISAGGYETCGIIDSTGAIECWGYEAISKENDEYAQVSVGFNGACGLRDSGSIDCFQTGTGTCEFCNGNANIPVPTSSDFVQLSAGWKHACGVKDNMTVECWGLDTNQGEFSPPVEFPYFAQVTAGLYLTCGLVGAYGADGGTVQCWGHDGYGQVSNVPAGGYFEVSAGGVHVCAVDDDQQGVCWGHNGYGQTNVPGGVIFTMPTPNP